MIMEIRRGLEELEGAEARGLLGHGGPEDVSGGGALEGRLPGQDPVGRDAQGVEVAAGVRGLTARDLGGDEVRGQSVTQSVPLTVRFEAKIETV